MNNAVIFKSKDEIVESIRTNFGEDFDPALIGVIFQFVEPDTKCVLKKYTTKASFAKGFKLKQIKDNKTGEECRDRIMTGVGEYKPGLNLIRYNVENRISKTAPDGVLPKVEHDVPAELDSARAFIIVRRQERKLVRGVMKENETMMLIYADCR